MAQLAEAEDLTIPGDVVGTLRYMSPEQLNGQADARSDIYSLGLTLYEMLTLRPVFGESSRTRLLKQISEAEPVPLSHFNAAVPRDLATVVSKAMAREPERRYPSASELAEDLGRFLRGEPIRARRVTVAERAWRWCRRNRSLAALAGAAILALLMAGILQKRVQNKPAEPLCRQKLAETLLLAVGYGRTPLSVEDKRSRLDQARQIAEQLIEERPDYPEYRVLLAKTQVRQAAVLGSIGDRDGANGLLEQSITLLEDLVELHPRSPQFAFLLATTLIATSGAADSTEDLESSRGRLERAISILENLSKEYPTAARWGEPYLDRAEQRLRRAEQSRDRE